MSKRNGKLSVKKETLRRLNSLTAEQLQAVGGGTYLAGGDKGYSVIVPPSRGPLTGGCDPDTTVAIYEYNFDGLKMP